MPYPPPETKPKTVNEWDRPAGLPGPAEERQLAVETLREFFSWQIAEAEVKLAWGNTTGMGLNFWGRLEKAKAILITQNLAMATPPPTYTVAVGVARGFFGNAAAVPGRPKPKPAEPEPLSKNGGRFVMLEDPE